MLYRSIPLALLVLFSFSGTLASQTVYVSPSGNDAWSGTERKPLSDASDGPVATLTRARNIIRAWKAAGKFTGIPHARGTFSTLTWLGFTSDATWETSFYIDNFTLHNQLKQ